MFSKNKKLDKYSIISDNIILNLDTRKTRRNNNVFMFYENGSARHKCFIEPNLKLCNCSYIIFDTNNQLQEITENLYKENGYEIKQIDFKNLNNSVKYNPFQNIEMDNIDADILQIVDNLVENFYIENILLKNNIKLILKIIIDYCFKKYKENCNFENINNTINEIIKRAIDEKVEPIDILKVISKETYKNDFSEMKNYKLNEIPKITVKEILYIIATNLCGFVLNEIKEFTSKNELDLQIFWKKPTILYINISQTTSYQKVIIPILMSQIFNRAIQYNTTQNPFHTKIVFDNFLHIGKIYDFGRYGAVLRKSNISYNIFVGIGQGFKRFKEIYYNDWECIIGNSDTVMYFGTNLESEIKKFFCNYDQPQKYIKPNKRNNFYIKKKIKISEPTTQISSGECVVAMRGIGVAIDKKYNLSDT